MELIVGNQLELAVSNSATSLSEKLLLQKELLSNQIYELENLVNTQCMLTGVNPLSQEMAAGALCVKIGKRPRDLLNPKAIQYMQFIFSIKDAVNKKETREIIASFGVTASQVRDFFNSQRAKVRKFIRLSKEKVKRTTSTVVPDGIQDGHDPAEPLNNPVPLDTVAPTSNAEVVHSFSAQEEKLSPAVVEAERYFVDNIFSLMRKEETFSGQAKLMEWILQIQNTSVLFWFSVNGGIMILATWLSEAILEEQTSILHVILKVLCHLPLQKATPVHMSAVLQSVNKLRFYRASDISNRARVLLSKWSKTFANMQAQKRANAKKTFSPSLDDMLLTQCINEVMGDDLSWDPKVHLNGDLSATLEDGSGNLRKLDSSPMKLLTSSADDQNKKLISGGRSSQSRERRKVLLVEQPGQRSANRSTQVSRHTTNAAQRRPLSADDIQKAKIRAQFMQSRYGKPPAPSSDENHSQAPQINIVNKNTGSEPSVLQQPIHNINKNTGSEPSVLQQPIHNINKTTGSEPSVLQQPIHNINKNAGSEPSVLQQPIHNINKNTGSEPSVLQQPIHNINKNTGSEPSVLQQPVHNINKNTGSEPSVLQQPIHNINKNTGSEPSVLQQPIHNINVEEKSKIDNQPTEISNQPDASVDDVAAEVKSDESPPKKRRRMEEIKWDTPPEMEIDISWRVGTGENSKELEIQKHRLCREHETVYKTIHEIPSDPKAPWDREMDYDDTLTPQIPIDQLPDDAEVTATLPNTEEQNAVNSIGSSSQGPDLELLAELLKNPQLVFALTSGQGGNLSSDETVRLLDMIKKNGVNSLNSLTDFGGGKEKAESNIEVSLPSPTPSSDPATNGRIADLSKNPFSRGVMVAELQQPPLALHNTVVVRRQENYVVQQPQLQHLTTTTSRVSSLQQRINSPMHHQTSTSSYAPNMMQQQQQQQLTVSELHTRNTHNSHVFTPEALPYNNHWQHRQGYHQHPTIDQHHQNNHNTETNQAYGGGARQFLQDNEGRFETWNPDETNQAYGGAHEFSQDEGRFETWNPDDSPVRSRGWNNTSSHSYNREERPRNYGHPPPPPPAAYGDQGWNSGNKRWNDRRR